VVEMVRRDRGRIDERMTLERCRDTAIGREASCEDAKRGDAVRSVGDRRLRTSLANTMASLAKMIDVEGKRAEKIRRIWLMVVNIQTKPRLLAEISPSTSKRSSAKLLSPTTKAEALSKSELRQ
jgi:hypothetical protein